MFMIAQYDILKTRVRSRSKTLFDSYNVFPQKVACLFISLANLRNIYYAQSETYLGVCIVRVTTYTGTRFYN